MKRSMRSAQFMPLLYCLTRACWKIKSRSQKLTFCGRLFRILANGNVTRVDDMHNARSMWNLSQWLRSGQAFLNGLRGTRTVLGNDYLLLFVKTKQANSAVRELDGKFITIPRKLQSSSFDTKACHDSEMHTEWVINGVTLEGSNSLQHMNRKCSVSCRHFLVRDL